MNKDSMIKYMVATGSVTGTRSRSVIERIIIRIKKYFE